jgi:hypothetical protein
MVLLGTLTGGLLGVVVLRDGTAFRGSGFAVLNRTDGTGGCAKAADALQIR